MITVIVIVIMIMLELPTKGEGVGAGRVREPDDAEHAPMLPPDDGEEEERG